MKASPSTSYLFPLLVITEHTEPLFNLAFDKPQAFSVKSLPPRAVCFFPAPSLSWQLISGSGSSLLQAPPALPPMLGQWPQHHTVPPGDTKVSGHQSLQPPIHVEGCVPALAAHLLSTHLSAISQPSFCCRVKNQSQKEHTGRQSVALASFVLHCNAWFNLYNNTEIK